MSVFPTQYSTLSAAALQASIADRYGWPLHRCRYLLRGVSDTYRLEGPEATYILKIYRAAHRSRAEIAGEVELLTYLHAQGARVAPPLPDRHGEFIQAFEAAEGTRYGVVFAFAPGRSFHDLSDEQVQVAGREMARLHNLTANLQLTHPRRKYEPSTLLTKPLAALAPAFAEYDYAEGHTYLREMGARVEARLQVLAPDSFSYGVCHYDFLPKNFHFDEQNQVTFFDFDFAGPGWLVNDVMTFFVHYFLHASTQRLGRAEADRACQLFVASYRALRPLSEAELAAIPYLGFLFWVFYLGFQYENFDDWSNSFFGPQFLRSRVGLIKQWVAMYTDL